MIFDVLCLVDQTCRIRQPQLFKVDYLMCLLQLLRFEKPVYMRLECYISSLILASGEDKEGGRVKGEKERERLFLCQIKLHFQTPRRDTLICLIEQGLVWRLGQEYYSKSKLRTDS